MNKSKESQIRKPYQFLQKVPYIAGMALGLSIAVYYPFVMHDHKDYDLFEKQKSSIIQSIDDVILSPFVRKVDLAKLQHKIMDLSKCENWRCEISNRNSFDASIKEVQLCFNEYDKLNKHNHLLKRELFYIRDLSEYKLMPTGYDGLAFLGSMVLGGTLAIVSILKYINRFKSRASK